MNIKQIVKDIRRIIREKSFEYYDFDLMSDYIKAYFRLNPKALEIWDSIGYYLYENTGGLGYFSSVSMYQNELPLSYNDVKVHSRYSDKSIIRYYLRQAICFSNYYPRTKQVREIIKEPVLI